MGQANEVYDKRVESLIPAFPLWRRLRRELLDEFLARGVIKTIIAVRNQRFGWKRPIRQRLSPQAPRMALGYCAAGDTNCPSTTQ